ncbi:ribonuclease HIII [Virgibacillus siamensis]|uniref:ribonuclease HIII n=1 Tax=Virgibacillus siamensis TaxID=480071 RepID=UPI0009874797|nr:ribonuclease HIII [Virgibacillus siamensis]
MPQLVNRYSSLTIGKMQQHYTACMQEPPQGAIFRAKTGNAVITAYKSGKVVFQGKNPETEADRWTPEQNGQKKTGSKTFETSPYAPPETLFTSSHIGSDEAGTGDYFGPITTAAAFVKQDQLELLKELGVQDSKNLSDTTIRKIATNLMHLDLPYSLLVLHNKKYNTLQKKGWSQGKMKAMLHHHAISKLQQKISTAPLDGILIDQFCEPHIYKKHIASEQQEMAENTYFMTKAEGSSLAVAAGSIIARASFLNEMDNLSNRVGFTLPKGASKKVDVTIARIIKAKGRNVLNTCAKTHFANTKKAAQYM